MLQEVAEDVGQEDFIPDLRKIHAAGKHLLALIHDVLDLSKVEAGKLELVIEDVDIVDGADEERNPMRRLLDKIFDSEISVSPDPSAILAA